MKKEKSGEALALLMAPSLTPLGVNLRGAKFGSVSVKQRSGVQPTRSYTVVNIVNF